MMHLSNIVRPAGDPKVVRTGPRLTRFIGQTCQGAWLVQPQSRSDRAFRSTPHHS
jgi:hypothetical protein